MFLMLSISSSGSVLVYIDTALHVNSWGVEGILPTVRVEQCHGRSLLVLVRHEIIW